MTYLVNLIGHDFASRTSMITLLGVLLLVAYVIGIRIF